MRLITNQLTYEGMLNAAFNQIRQFSAGSPSVVIRLVESLATIDQFATKPSYCKAIAKHTKMVVSMAKDTFKEKNDFKDLKKRSRFLD